MASRRSVQVRKSVGPVAMQQSLGGFGAQKGASNKLAAHRLELLEVAFGAYADEETSKIGMDDLEKVLGASLSRYLEREIDDMKDEHDDDAELQLVDVKSLVMQEQPFINKSWHEIIASRPKNQQMETDPDDLFQQLYESHKMLVDSSSGQDGSLDVHALEYILATCGEEVEHDDFDLLLDKIKHPRKGNFEMSRLIMYLAGLMEEVGIAGSEELAKVACKRIDDISADKAKAAGAAPARNRPSTGAALKTQAPAPDPDVPAASSGE